MTVESHDLDPQTGELPGVRVVGFHGELDGDQTPARSQPVWVDDHHRMLWIVDPGRLQAHAKLPPPPPGKCWIDRPSEATISQTGPLPGVATRVGPWPARLGWALATIGPRELNILTGLRVDAPDALASRVDKFLEWLVMGERRSDALSCERQGVLVHWYCAAADEIELRTRIRFVATRALIRDAQGPALMQLKKTSYWLARAATHDEDVYRAAAGLLRAFAGHSPRVDSLLTTVMYRRSKDETVALLAEAATWLSDACKANRPALSPYVAATKYRDRLRNCAMSSPAATPPAPEASA